MDSDSIPHLEFKPHHGLRDTVHCRYNLWSIISGPFSMGGGEGLYEVMGPGFSEDDNECVGHLTLGEVLTHIMEYEANN
jgi:hypothetical protein